MGELIISKGEQAAYNAISTKDNNTMYIVTDTKRGYLGNERLWATLSEMNINKDSNKGFIINPNDSLTCEIGDYQFWVKRNSTGNYASIGLTSLNGTIPTFWSYVQTYDAAAGQYKTSNDNIDSNGVIMDNDLGYSRGGMVKGLIMNKNNQDMYSFECVVTYQTTQARADMAAIMIEKLT